MRILPLMRSLLALLVGLMLANIATAQTATDPNEGSRLTYDSILGSYSFSWWGQPGRTYFVQHSDDLSAWEYLPLIESGANSALAWGFTSTASKFFLRLRSADIPTTDPFTADFDGDKVSNYDELLQGTDPLSAADTDANGLPDDWEMFYFGHLGVDPTADSPGGGMTNQQHFGLGSNPNNAPPPPTLTAGTPILDQDASQSLYPANDTGLLLQNGNFNAPAYAAGTWGVTAGITGWTAISGTLVELQNFTNLATAGQYCELDSHWPTNNHSGPSDHGIQQTVNLARGHYLLIFDYRARQTGADSFVVKLKNSGSSTETVLLTKSAALTTAWKRATASFDVTGGNPNSTTLPITLLFDEVGARDSYGPYIDNVILLRVDIDVVHPATGELSEAKEDAGDGGYVSVRRMVDGQDVTPITKLVVHAISGAQSSWKTRLKFAAAARFKIYSNEARTQEITSEQTEFSATAETTLYIQGLKKSASRGGEEITMQIGLDGQWFDGDSLKCTVVQSEFLFQLKAFIPYAWTETESEDFSFPPMNLLKGKVAKGDLHSLPGTRVNGRPASPGFVNAYSTDAETGSSYALFDNAPFRVCQTVIITPYEELHSTADIAGKRAMLTAPLSEHYLKATGVAPADLPLHMGFIDLNSAGFSKSGKPLPNTPAYDNIARSGRVSELTIDGGGRDGAMPFGTLWASHDIHWRIYLKVWCDKDPLNPKVEFGGKHDSYPAYEIIVIQSDGSFKDIHRVSPVPGLRPGPGSLAPSRAVNVGRTDTITK